MQNTQTNCHHTPLHSIKNHCALLLNTILNDPSQRNKEASENKLLQLAEICADSLPCCSDINCCRFFLYARDMEDCFYSKDKEDDYLSLLSEFWETIDEKTAISLKPPELFDLFVEKYCEFKNREIVPSF